MQQFSLRLEGFNGSFSEYYFFCFVLFAFAYRSPMLGNNDFLLSLQFCFGAFRVIDDDAAATILHHITRYKNLLSPPSLYYLLLLFNLCFFLDFAKGSSNQRYSNQKTMGYEKYRLNLVELLNESVFHLPFINVYPKLWVEINMNGWA